jgi:nitroreductase
MSELFSGRSPETLDLLLRRRSSLAKAMGEPGPSTEQTRLILQAGMPDHGKLAPWRFLVFEDEGRAEFGEVLATVLAARKSNISEALLRFERGRFLRAPLVIAVISSPQLDKAIPEWEQRLSAGAACLCRNRPRTAERAPPPGSGQAGAILARHGWRVGLLG